MIGKKPFSYTNKNKTISKRKFSIFYFLKFLIVISVLSGFIVVTQIPKANANEEYAIVNNEKSLESSKDSSIYMPVTAEPTAQIVTPNKTSKKIPAIKKELDTVKRPLEQEVRAKINPVSDKILTPKTQKMIWPVINGKGVFMRGLFPGHNGIDIADKSSPFLVSSSDGIVTHTGLEKYGAGESIRIQYDNGYRALYAHTRGNYMVREGDVVKQGQILANMGRSGTATGLHLHYELIDPNGNIVNPLKLLVK